VILERKKGRTMHKLTALAIALSAVLPIATAAYAAAPVRDSVVQPYEYVATDCGFPVTVSGVFTNRITDSALDDGTGTLRLYQSDVATATANGLTARVNSHYTISVTILDGIPVEAKHTGLLDSIIGPNGEHIFFRTGLAKYEVVFDPDLGFYVDGPVISRHGIRDDFDLSEFCAAFG
jgi:hypothetical protein